MRSGDVMIRVAFVFTSFGVALMFGGCGTWVPDIQEMPGDVGAGQVLVQDIVTSVHCEVADAIQWVILNDRANEIYKSLPKNPKTKKPHYASDFLSGWGVQMTLSLTVEEKTTGNPTVVATPAGALSSVFTLAGTATLSTDATRIDKLNFYYSIPDLLNRHYCTPGVQHGTAASLLIQADLKTKQWLQDYMQIIYNNEIIAPTNAGLVFKENALSHEVKFEVVSTGGVTPAWKLITATVGQTGTLFSTTRDRTHDLTVTFGPGDPNGLTGQAAQAAFAASLVGLEIANHLKGITLP